RRCGLDVVAAADGREALEIFARRAAEIDVVVLDRTLPGTAGEEIFAAMQRIRPGVRAVLMSGYAQESAVSPGLARFLRKPFTHEERAEEVRLALDGRG